MSGAEDPLQRPPQRVMIWRVPDADVSQRLWIILQDGLSAAQTHAVELAHDQTCEKLGKRVIMPGKLARELREQPASQSVSRLHHLPWRSTGFHLAVCNEMSGTALPNKRRTWRGLRQSRDGPFPDQSIS